MMKVRLFPALLALAAMVAGPAVASDAYAYPNPAVASQNSTIRATLGLVDQVEISIFNMAGRIIHRGSIGGTPTGYSGGHYYDYTWSGSKPSGIYFAVIHGRRADGAIVKAQVNFAVVR